MANTTNLNLVKPAGTDYALVSVINGNMDIIDSKVGAIPANESAQSQITALNNHIKNNDVSGLTFTPNSNFTVDEFYKYRKGDIATCVLIGTYSGSVNTETQIGTVTGFEPRFNGTVISHSTTANVGGFYKASGGRILVNVSVQAKIILSWTAVL